VDITLPSIFGCAGQIRLENAEIQIPTGRTGPKIILAGEPKLGENSICFAFCLLIFELYEIRPLTLTSTSFK
jgi:hypothetical protein